MFVPPVKTRNSSKFILPKIFPSKAVIEEEIAGRVLNMEPKKEERNADLIIANFDMLGENFNSCFGSSVFWDKDIKRVLKPKKPVSKGKRRLKLKVR